MFVTSVPRGKATKKQIGQLRPDGTSLMMNKDTLTIYGDVIPPVLAAFDYTGAVQTWTVPATGWYKLDVQGAGGGPLAGYTGDYEPGDVTKLNGGKGGYSTTTVKLQRGTTLYIVVGGHGYSSVTLGSGDTDYALNQKQDITDRPADFTDQGGYNGGGYPNSTGFERGAGGGATHIATANGLLSELENNKNAVLVVAGGGGGGGRQDGGEHGQGGSGGGAIGGIGAEEAPSQQDYVGEGGTQNAGGASTHGDVGSFGQGANRSSEADYGGSGGGGGQYGGGSSINTAGAGGGSGYLTPYGKANKSYMYGFEVPTNNLDFTRTFSTTNYSEIPVRDQAKAGDGYAIISRAVTPLVPFSNDSNQEEIFNMIDAYYRGEISLSEIKSVQSVGDTIQANATTMNRFKINAHTSSIAMYNGSSTVTDLAVPEQSTVKQVIVDFNHDTLETPINGITKALLTLRMDGCISNNAGESTFGSTAYDNYGGNTEQGGCEIRTYLNGNFYNACEFKPYIKSVVKEFYDYSTGVEQQTMDTSNDKVFLPSRQELQDYEEPGTADHELEGTVYELFKNSSGRSINYGYAGGGSIISTYQTRTRQPGANVGEQYVHYYNGTSTYSAANVNRYISPMICL